jgi:hypothetical protein
MKTVASWRKAVAKPLPRVGKLKGVASPESRRFAAPRCWLSYVSAVNLAFVGVLSHHIADDKTFFSGHRLGFLKTPFLDSSAERVFLLIFNLLAKFWAKNIATWFRKTC